MTASRQTASVRAMHQASRPVFEMLEERQHFSVYVVTNTLDSGNGSLRTAIDYVNSGKDTAIGFNISKNDHGYSSSSKMWTINLQSELPALQKALTIDGYSQPGYTNKPLIEINGQGMSSPGVGFQEEAGHTTIRGLSMDNFTTAIELQDPAIGGDVIDGNAFGASPGSVGLTTAIFVEAPNCNIGQNTGNVITLDHNTQAAISVSNSSNTTIAHNTITALTQSNPNSDGILLESGCSNDTVSNNNITYAGTGIDIRESSSNTVSKNQTTFCQTGILLDMFSSNSKVLGNTVRYSNTAGIQVQSNGNTIGTIGDGNTIDRTYIYGGGDNILIQGGSNTIDGNTCSNAGQYGIHVECEHNTIQGNGVTNNFDGGIFLDNGASDTLVGGYSKADANVIDGPYLGVGVGLYDWGDTIVGNSISVNQGYTGITLAPGANYGQAAPVIDSAHQFGGTLSVTGTVHSWANSSVRVELFSSTAETPTNPMYGPLGNEGQTYLGQVTVTTDASGNATFNDSIAIASAGKMITATATRDGNTSEFSNAVTDTWYLWTRPIHFPIFL